MLMSKAEGKLGFRKAYLAPPKAQPLNPIIFHLNLCTYHENTSMML
jgi:hypothetical protein